MEINLGRGIGNLEHLAEFFYFPFIFNKKPEFCLYGAMKFPPGRGGERRWKGEGLKGWRHGRMEGWGEGGMEGWRMKGCSLCERLLPPGVPSLQGQPGIRGERGGDRRHRGGGRGHGGRSPRAVSVSHRLFPQNPNQQIQPNRGKRHPRAKLDSPFPKYLLKLKILPSSSKAV